MWSPITFTLTEEHLKLLTHMYVGWSTCEYGAPEIDPKRPYGNSSVEEDIGEILGEEPEGMDLDYPDDPEYTDEQRERYAALHLETQTALQIALETLKFEVGTYEKANQYTGKWVKVA